MLSVVCVAKIEDWQLPTKFKNCWMPTIKYQIIGVKSFMLDVKCFTEIDQHSSFKTVDKSIPKKSPSGSELYHQCKEE